MCIGTGARQAHTAVSSGEVMRFLWVADGDAGWRRMVAETAEARGWTVRQFATATDVHAAFEDREEPDLVILDMGLPDGDSVEVIIRMTTRQPGGRVLITSASEVVYATIGKLLGDAGGLDVLDALQKPIPVKDLREYLDKTPSAYKALV